MPTSPLSSLSSSPLFFLSAHRRAPSRSAVAGGRPLDAAARVRRRVCGAPCVRVRAGWPVLACAGRRVPVRVCRCAGACWPAGVSAVCVCVRAGWLAGVCACVRAGAPRSECVCARVPQAIAGLCTLQERRGGWSPRAGGRRATVSSPGAGGRAGLEAGCALRGGQRRAPGRGGAALPGRATAGPAARGGRSSRTCPPCSRPRASRVKLTCLTTV